MPDRPTPKRIKTMDELLLAAEIPYEAAKGNGGITAIKFSQIQPFKNHPFHLYSGERLDDMVESVKDHGILIPMIVRRIDDDSYEMLSGHNHINAAKLAGLDEGPCIIKENLTDDEALIYVIETNVMQRSFADMLPSEKASVISLGHSKMFSQGKRNDIILELKMLENPQYIKEKSTSPLLGEKLHSDVQLGIEYGLSKNSVTRFLRIDKLTKALKKRVDASEIGMYPAVSLSYLSEDEQQKVEKVLSENKFKVDMKKTDMLRSYSESDKLDEKSAYQILSGEINRKPKSTTPPPVKIKHKIYSKYFPADTKASEIERVIDEALEKYFANKNTEGAE
jgi:ParB family chromosome partitioning protein